MDGSDGMGEEKYINPGRWHDTPWWLRFFFRKPPKRRWHYFCYDNEPEYSTEQEIALAYLKRQFGAGRD